MSWTSQSSCDRAASHAHVYAQAAYAFRFNANGASNQSYDPNYVYCRFIERNGRPGPLGVPNRVYVTYRNQGSLKTECIHSQVGPGRFRVSSLVNHIKSFTTLGPAHQFTGLEKFE